MEHPTQRLHYMDNLRATLMILGVFFHAALAYSPMLHNLWLSADQVSSPAMDHFANFLHLFRMPLFFAVAGFFAALLVARRGLPAMLKNRARRVLLPFVIFWPLVTAGILVPLIWAMANVNNLPPLLQFISAMQDIPDAPQPPPSTTHLWFLYYLVFFYLLVWVARLLIPVAVKNRLLALHPALAIAILPLLLVPGLLGTSVPFPAPERFVPELWAFGFYGLFFAYGYLLYTSSNLVDYFQRLWPLLLVVALLMYALLQGFYPRQITLEEVMAGAASRNWPERLLTTLLAAYISVFMSVAGMVLAKHLLNGRNAFMRLMSDASYWIYITHLPILLAIQYWLLDQPGGVAYKYTVSVTLTLAACMVSYFLLVRWTPVGWLLNGRKKPVASVADNA